LALDSELSTLTPESDSRLRLTTLTSTIDSRLTRAAPRRCEGPPLFLECYPVTANNDAFTPLPNSSGTRFVALFQEQLELNLVFNRTSTHSETRNLGLELA